MVSFLYNFYIKKANTNCPIKCSKQIGLLSHGQPELAKALCTWPQDPFYIFMSFTSSTAAG